MSNKLDYNINDDIYPDFDEIARDMTLENLKDLLGDWIFMCPNSIGKIRFLKNEIKLRENQQNNPKCNYLVVTQSKDL